MITKTLILTLIFIAAYSLLLQLRNPGMSVSNHQWQDNSIKAENFLYKAHRYQKVIVGSSLSSRLIIDSLPGYYNLCFAGMSVFEGLKILKEEEVLPDVVFIEMNTIFSKENEGFTSAILNPLMHQSKKFAPAIRDGKQPLSRLKPVVTTFLAKAGNGMKRFFPQHSNSSHASHQLLDITLHETVEIYRIVPDQQSIDATFDHLDKYVQYLLDHRVKVVFFELPMNPIVSDLPYFKVLRRSFHTRYPTLTYLAMTDSRFYNTTDGLHLNPEEAARYTSFFKEQSSKE